jgi:glycosyltransferase involved in cell wall biosynthesis
MKIAQVMAGASAGGAELFFERLALALHRAGDTILPVIRRDSGRAGRLAAGGLAPLQLRFGGALDLLTRPRVATALRGFAPRVVVAWMNRAARQTPPGDWVLAGRLGGYYDLRYYRACDHLIGNTRGIVAWIRGQGWPASRVHHLPNFAPDLAGSAPAALPVPPGAPVVLALGRLHRNKAFDILIRALPLLPGVHVVIAGDGPERAALASLARDLGVRERLHLAGWRTDQAALLARCDLLACPSRHEPLGNVVIEAFSAGRPVVAADAAGPVELIVPDRDGLLVPREDPEALAAAIAAVLARPALAARLGQAGRARYEAEHAEAPVLAQWRMALAAMERA